MTLESPVESIKGIGAVLAAKFAQVGIRTVEDLWNYYPRRYDDYSDVLKISQIKPGHVTIKAEIKQVMGRYVRRGMHITEAVASDDSGSVRLIWFNQSYRASSLDKGKSYYISGNFELSRQKLSIMNPSCELVSDFPINTARIVPKYREIKGLTSLQIRKALRASMATMDSLPETLPNWLIAEHRLISYADALKSLHFPEDQGALTKATQRLGFEEVFSLTLAALINKQMNQTESALAIPFNESLAKEFVRHLPFTLTDAQRKVVWRIYQDIAKGTPMNRLIEGDVGSGKTVVAAMAAVMAIEQKFQVALMAPTELLAKQHAETLYRLLEPLGYGDHVGLLVGGLRPKQKQLMHKKIAQGDVRLIVGTHALISEKVDMHNLGMVVVDEQHRFGVAQRKKLQAKAGHALHVLSMTATPIPRSLALTLYGEMDISVISQKPSNRKPIITEICSPNSRTQLYKKIDSELANGQQLFVVCPLITESEQSTTKRSAENVFKELSQGPFKHRRVGLLHGKMKTGEKQSIMNSFVKKDLDVLVATTVIEVGVDVPNATVMLIENADQFGLAQLHQLRGRVGRSSHQGYCYLMMTDSKAPSKRIRALEKSSDGFKLAELDLELRGPGAIYGHMQHGQLDLRIAKLSDTKLIAAARQAASEFLEKEENLLNYKQLASRVNRLQAVTNLN